MSMQKTMILPVCLGILLVGIVMIPSVFAADGCGTGTVLVNGVCQLAPTQTKTSFMSIEPLYIIIGVVAIGGIIGAIAVARRGSKTPKPSKQKTTKEKETLEFCIQCGTELSPETKFCGKCGTPKHKEFQFTI